MSDGPLSARNLQNSRAHFDDDLAEGSSSQMLVGVTRFLEGIDLIDHWTNLMFVEDIVHAFKGPGRSYSNPPDGGLPNITRIRSSFAVCPCRKPICEM